MKRMEELKPRTRGKASEEIALAVLREMGFKVVEKRKRVIIDGVEVAEVDGIVEKDGERYAVEIKAGPADVSTIRYAYANAKILGLKPLVVARGFSNEAAKVVAQKLGVNVIELSDLFLVNGEELYVIVKNAVREALYEVLLDLFNCKDVNNKDREILKAIAFGESFIDTANALGTSVEELAEKVADLKRRGIIRASGGFENLRLEALIKLLCIRLFNEHTHIR
jgi:predicted RecB family endonuclease